MKDGGVERNAMAPVNKELDKKVVKMRRQWRAKKRSVNDADIYQYHITIARIRKYTENKTRIE